MVKGALSPTSSAMVVALDRELTALELRKQGLTFAQIGAEMGITRQGARECVLRAVQRRNEEIPEAVDEMRAVVGDRLDAMTKAIWKKAMDGDLAAVMALLRIEDRRAKLFGLDVTVTRASSPDDPQGTDPYEMTLDDVRRVLAEAAAAKTTTITMNAEAEGEGEETETSE